MLISESGSTQDDQEGMLLSSPCAVGQDRPVLRLQQWKFLVERSQNTCRPYHVIDRRTLKQAWNYLEGHLLDLHAIWPPREKQL